MEKVKSFTRKNHIGKRFLSIILSIAMVLTMSNVFSVAEVVQAADTSVRLYFELPDGSSASDWAANVWGSSITVSGDSTNAFRPSTWGDGDTYPALIAAENTAWGYVDVSGSVEGMQFVNASGTEYNCWNAQITAQGLTEAYYSPTDGKWYSDSSKTNEVTEAEDLTCFVLAGEEGLAGSSWDISDTSNYFVQDGGDTNKYSLTRYSVAAGTYEYKVLQDPVNKGWDLPWGGSDNASVTVSAPSNVTFSLDTTDESRTLNVTKTPIEAIVVENANVVKGASLALNTTATYYDGTGNAGKSVAITYTYSGDSEDVTLTGNTITVAKDSKLTSVDLVATVTTEGISFSQKITLTVVDKEYTVTLHMCSVDGNVSFTTGSDIYIFNCNGDETTVVEMTSSAVDEDDESITWVTGKVTVSYTALGIIGRPTAGSWDGQDSNQYYTISENADSVELWYVFGDGVYDEKPTDLAVSDARYFYLEYENASLGDIVPQFYSWTIGVAGYDSVCIDFEEQDDGSWLVKVPVSSTCTKVDYVLVLDASASSWVKDGGDHSVSFPLDQTVVYAKMSAGEEPELSAPYNIGYELMPGEGTAAFYYRDDSALMDGTLSDMNVSVDVDGTEYTMTYNEANKRFECVVTLEERRLHYRYVVSDSDEKEYVLDKYNENSEAYNDAEYSYVDYYVLDAEINAQVMYEEFNYNQNNVVSFTVTQSFEGEDNENDPAFEVASASVDISALGGSSELDIDPELLAITIAVTRDTELGTYTLPIVVTDQYANEYKTTVDVTVVERVKEDEDDFDWDEAVIYFMVTDRFFDGNPENNTASGEDTYGDNEGLYHGGDFAGITEKLDYLDDLGINTIWITPIVKNIDGVEVTGDGSDDVPYNASYHGYWASDFTSLNPTLGTEEEFETLIEEAHKRGIKIMVDIVINHAGYGTEGSFNNLLTDEDGNYINMIRSGDDVVSGDDQKDSLSGLPDFLTEKEEVREQLVKWQTQWIKDYDIDYYRVDTVKHVEGTTWEALKNSLTEVNSEFKMIGEYSGGGYATSGGTLGTGQMDSILDFDFADWATSFVNGSITSVESSLTARNDAINNTLTTGQFLSSHDEDGFKYNLENSGMTEEEATAASLVAATLQITAKGQPVIYYGEEIGLTGANDYPYQTNRYDFDWDLVTEDNVTYQHYKKLLAIRNEYTDVFVQGDRQSVMASDEDGYDVISRTYDDTTLYVGMNIESEAQILSIDVDDTVGTIYEDLYNDTEYVVASDGTISVTIPSANDGGTVILKSTGRSSSSDSSSDSSSGSTTTDLTDDTADTTDTAGDESGSSDGTVEDSDWEKQTSVKAEKDEETGLVVTVNTREDGTATITKIKATTEKTITVPSTVTVNGEEYTVTKISNKAFAKATEATKIVLPSTITKIGAKAFSGAKKVKTIVINSTDAITVSKTAFKGLNTEKITVKVKVSKNGMTTKEYKSFKKALKAIGFKGTIKKK